ncbi:MAG: hypothetical protein KAV82_04605 [Phycisphaerae bacterium]|nr:hypothetical protein [Phycisphaerae bacterium]
MYAKKARSVGMLVIGACLAAGLVGCDESWLSVGPFPLRALDNASDGWLTTLKAIDVNTAYLSQNQDTQWASAHDNLIQGREMDAANVGWHFDMIGWHFGTVTYGGQTGGGGLTDDLGPPPPVPGDM